MSVQEEQQQQENGCPFQFSWHRVLTIYMRFQAQIPRSPVGIAVPNGAATDTLDRHPIPTCNNECDICAEVSLLRLLFPLISHEMSSCVPGAELEEFFPGIREHPVVLFRHMIL